MKTNNPILIPEHSITPTITTCWCNSPYHCVYWYKEKDDDGNTTLAFSLFVNPLVGLWQRIKNAIKYIFQIGSLEFDEWRISNESFEDFVKLVDDIKDDRRFDNKTFKSNNQNETNNDDVKLVDEEYNENRFIKPRVVSPSEEDSFKIHFLGNGYIPINTKNTNAILETEALIKKSNTLFSELIQYENLISKCFADKEEDRPKLLTKYEAMTYINYIDGNVNGLDLSNRDKFRKQFNDSCLSGYIGYKDIVRLWGGFKKFKEDFKA